MSFPFRNQPLKGLYIIYQVLSTFFIRIPWWALRSLPRSWRPRRSWSLRRTIRANTLRHTIQAADKIGFFGMRPNHLALETDVGSSGVWIEPVPDLIVGEIKALADFASVESIRIPGYWMHKDGINVKVASPPTAGEKIIYHLHGGAYVRCSAHPSDVTAMIPRGIMEFADSVHRTFSVEYRLSSARPFAVANPFPAALIDAVAGYSYLVNNVGFAPADIIVTGDSAGGNLAHALTRYLVENWDSSIENLPAPPGGLILFSPWCDASDSHEVPGSSAFNFRSTDIITPDVGSFAKRLFLVPMGFPRTLITAGSVEILVDQIRLMRKRMADDLGEGDGAKPGEGKVQYLEEPDAVHDYAIFDWHEPEKTNTLKEAARWIEAATS
ncbi:Alpha/Beta hydrolase protein [Amanita rubescens]|nr:Alpha/Beta hydrolase protein [Amanita rubescens]